MILSSDCDQFICVCVLGDRLFNKPNSITVIRITFIPRELFNMIQLQIMYFNPLDIKKRYILNLVPITIRKNLRNVNYTSMIRYYSEYYTHMTIRYLRGDIYSVPFRIRL